MILAGGLGTRISEETADKPKPMVLIGGKPIIWHVMSIYALQGYKDFLIAGGYKSDAIKDWVSSITEDWCVRVVDTGLATQTAGRIKKCLKLVEGNKFFLTYGDGLGNVNLSDLVDANTRNNSIATVTAVRPPARFGSLDLSGEIVQHFGEKSQLSEGWINGGFFLLSREIEGFLDSDEQIFESEVLPRLSRRGDLSALRHYGFWKPMDTLREKQELEILAKEDEVPWLRI